MTRYWVIRTDKAKTNYVSAESAQGRLREGWAWADEQDLRVMAAAQRQRVSGPYRWEQTTELNRPKWPASIGWYRT
jgi:hypothetical protein